MEPPPELSDAEAQVWRDIAATKPADWFGPDSAPLLAEYCRAVIQAKHLAAMLHAVVGKKPTKAALERYERIARLQHRNAALIKSLATAMRLSQQSRYGARGANSHAGRAGNAPSKPWQAAG